MDAVVTSMCSYCISRVVDLRVMKRVVWELIRGTDHASKLILFFYAAAGFLKSFVKSYCIEFMS